MRRKDFTRGEQVAYNTCDITNHAAGTPEQTYSTYQRVKSYLRNTPDGSRSNGLAMLNINPDVEVDPAIVLETLNN